MSVSVQAVIGVFSFLGRTVEQELTTSCQILALQALPLWGLQRSLGFSKGRECESLVWMICVQALRYVFALYLLSPCLYDLMILVRCSS
jgi:hypothetical protein